MDLNDSGLIPARPSGLGRDELAEAIDRMTRERQPSVNKMAATFSTPQAYNLDQLHEQAKGSRPATPAQQAPDQQRQPWKTTRQENPKTILGSLGDEFLGRMKADSQEYARQEREDRIRSQRQAARQQGQPQPQDLPQPLPERGPQDVSIGNRPAQAPWGRPDTVSTIPSTGSLGGQFPQGTFASPEEVDALRDKLSGQPSGRSGIGDLVRGVRQGREWTEEPRTLDAPSVNQHAADTFSPRRRYKNNVSQPLSTGQFGDMNKPDGKPLSDAMRFGRDVIKDAGEDLPEAL